MSVIFRVIFLLIVLFLVSGCSIQPQTLTEIYPHDLSRVTKIIIMDGSTGEKRLLSRKADIQNSLNQLSELTLIPDKNQQERDGFLYGVQIYEGNKRTFSFTHNKIEDFYFHTDQDIINIMREMFQEAERVAYP